MIKKTNILLIHIFSPYCWKSPIQVIHPFAHSYANNEESSLISETTPLLLLHKTDI